MIARMHLQFSIGGQAMQTKNTGVTRLYKAFFYSAKGVRYAYTHEAAFRQEILLALLLIPVALILPVSHWQSLALILSVLLVLLVELLNSAIEAVVDRVGTQYHELAGSAKDMGSAAVLVALIMCFSVWGVILWDRFILK